jgi:hypothetical protein
VNDIFRAHGNGERAAGGRASWSSRLVINEALDWRTPSPDPGRVSLWRLCSSSSSALPHKVWRSHHHRRPRAREQARVQEGRGQPLRGINYTLFLPYCNKSIHLSNAHTSVCTRPIYLAAGKWQFPFVFAMLVASCSRNSLADHLRALANTEMSKVKSIFALVTSVSRKWI